jgi:hypothetical protein
MYVPYKTDEENKRYIRTHKPWVIAYRMLDFIDGEYYISNAETFMYTNNFNGVLRRDYNIVGKDCCEKFMQFLMQPTISSHYKYIYAHNGAKFDNILMLNQIVKMTEMKTDPLFNAGRLLTLKVKTEKGVVDFRDSNLLLNMPLKSFNKELGLGLHMEKEVQEYEFMTEDILDRYIENGGVFETIGNLVNSGALKREMYNVTDTEWEQYIAAHGNDDYVSRYIDYCK